MTFDFNRCDFIENNPNSHKLALAATDGDLSWEQLRHEVYRTRDELLTYKLPKGHPVIIRGHKEKAFVVSMIACIMLELPYIPIDIIYPEERLAKIQTMTLSALTIDCTHGRMIFRPEHLNMTYYDAKEPLIYIIFTSGSTGEPKGVQISKNAITSFLEWIAKDFGFTQKDVFLNQAPFSFDLSVYELYAFLYFGATLVLTSSVEQKDTERLLQKIQKYACTVWVSTPSFLALCFLSEHFNMGFLPGLHTFLFCGETLPSRVAKRLLILFPNAAVMNSYGPTEATVATTRVTINEHIIAQYPTLPVGYPKFNADIVLTNTEIDEEGREVGIITIGGDHVMTGYFANPETTEKLLTCKDGKRFFSTGDYGYFKDGMLFFMGRRDNQVKLHGYRIEMDEIDAALHQIDTVQDAITIAMYRNGEVAKLVACIIPIAGQHPDSLTDEIKAYLSVSLPYYMIPADFMFIDQFPYSTNHKICLPSLRDMYQNIA